MDMAMKAVDATLVLAPNSDQLLYVEFLIGTEDHELARTTAAGKDIPVFENETLNFK
jgi:hypothetical protein